LVPSKDINGSSDLWIATQSGSGLNLIRNATSLDCSLGARGELCWFSHHAVASLGNRRAPRKKSRAEPASSRPGRPAGPFDRTLGSEEHAVQAADEPADDLFGEAGNEALDEPARGPEQ